MVPLGDRRSVCSLESSTSKPQASSLKPRVLFCELTNGKMSKRIHHVTVEYAAEVLKR